MHDAGWEVLPTALWLQAWNTAALQDEGQEPTVLGTAMAPHCSSAQTQNPVKMGSHGHLGLKEERITLSWGHPDSVSEFSAAS